MGTWVIGDVHGCFYSLKRLWRRLDFDWENDRLWMVGDLVNRGPKSLQVLRWARRRSRRLGDRMAVVLGNHDLHLLAIDRGISAPKDGDTLAAVLEAKDRRRLLNWLREQHFLYRQGDIVLVHAGILPQWSLKKATKKARRLREALGTDREDAVLARRVEDTDGRRSSLKLRQSTYAFTLLRSCTPSGLPCSFSGPPESAPDGCQPWYRLWDPIDHGVTVVCGHWAAQGLKVRPGMIALDSGCVWGGALTAIRLEDLRIVQQPSVETRRRTVT